MMMVINQEGVATGGALASGHAQERWVAAWLCSSRAAGPGVQGPGDHKGRNEAPKTPPKEWMAAVPSGGAASHKPLLSDGGVRGDDWLAHWAKVYGCAGPPGVQSRASCPAPLVAFGPPEGRNDLCPLEREFWAQVSWCPQHVGAADAGGGDSGGV